MVFSEPAYVVTQREYAARGDDPRLAHRPPHLLLQTPRLADELTRTCECRSDRSAKPFSKIDPRRVEKRRVFARADTARHRRIHEPSAVEVCAHIMSPRHRRNCGDARERPD